MDYMVRKEINAYKADIEASKEALDAEKFMFIKKLNGSFGEKMMESLENPKKPSFWEGVKNRARRRKTIKENKNKEKEAKDKNKTGDV